MQKIKKWRYSLLALCFFVFLAGFFLGRQSVGGVILRPQQAAAPTEAAERSLPAGQTATEGRLELNHAGLEELSRLPGIGPVRAQRILDYREENGPFRAAAELMNVEGIGEGIYAGLMDLIYVE